MGTWTCVKLLVGKPRGKRLIGREGWMRRDTYIKMDL
jgi:hypothetical protein